MSAVAPDEKILRDMGKEGGSVSLDIDLFEKYIRSAGFGENNVRNDEFILVGLCPDAF